MLRRSRTTSSSPRTLPGATAITHESVPPSALLFAPDGYLYVPSFNTAAGLRYDGQTGVFDSVFVPPGSGGLVRPHGMILGPDGSLNVCSFQTGEIKRYDGTTGALLGEAIMKHPRGPRGPTVVVRVPNPRPRLRPLDPGLAGMALD